MNSKDIVQSVVDGEPIAGWTIFRFNKLRWAFMTWSMFIVANVTASAGIIFFWEFIRGGELVDVPFDEQIYGGIMLLISLIFTVIFIKKLKSIFHTQSNVLVVTEERIVKSWNGIVYEYNIPDILNPVLHYTTGYNSLYHNKYIEFKNKSTNRIDRIGYSEYYKDIRLMFNVINNKIN